jgi:hypothetical protein
MKKSIKNLTLAKRKISLLNQLEVSRGIVESATPTIFMTLSYLICGVQAPAQAPVQNHAPVNPIVSSNCH